MFVVAATLALSRSGHVGRWLNRYGVATGVIYGLGGFGIVLKAHGPFEAFDSPGTILFAVWALTISIRLLRGPAPDAALAAS